MGARKLSDWISAYIEYTEETEPPLSYHVWSGLSAIAAALQRKVYMDWNFQRIFPNMYIVLVGPSGRCKKGTAMNMAKDLLSGIQSVKMTADSVTREAVIKNMEDAESSFTDPDGLMQGTTAGLCVHSSLTVFSDELSVFLGQNDTKFLANLTDWYDSKENWSDDTRGRGKEAIKGVCVNLLGGTAPDWFRSILPEEAIGGGFTSRIFFIVEERKRKTVALHQPTNREKKLRELLSEDLERINKIKGFYEFTEEATDMYVEWYTDQDRLIDQGTYPVRDSRFAGYCDRRATHIKKLCMVFAASRGDNLVIDPSDFERALEVMVKAEVNMPKAFSGLGDSDYVVMMERIIKYFQRYPGEKIRRELLLIEFFRDMDMASWEIIRDQLEAMKWIKVSLDPIKSSEEYLWTGPKD